MISWSVFALVLISAPAASTPTPTPKPIATVTPAPAPVATPAPARAPAKARDAAAFSIEAGAVAYVRWSARRFDPVAPGLTVSALRAFGSSGLSAGGGLGWRHHTGGRTFDEYRGRVLAPYVADIDAVPVEVIARYSREAGPVAVFAQAGAGLEYAHSSYTRSDMLPRRIREDDWAPTSSARVGAAMPLAGGRLGANLGVRFARHAFAAHDFDLLHGVEAVAGWQRSF